MMKAYRPSCECCGKRAPNVYYSWSKCNDHGVGVTLHGKCAAFLEPWTEAAVLAFLRLPEGQRKEALAILTA